ncbi:MAG: hypothetical protein KA978_26845, partial [Deltaproteobacteria bacterium]|nr:hypothetical protein [Deltaproteobacteria bacterium]
AVARSSRTPVVAVALVAATLSFVALYLVGSSPPPTVTAPSHSPAAVAPVAAPAVAPVAPPTPAPIVATPAAVDAGTPPRRPVARPVVRPVVVARPRVHEHLPVE